MSKKDDVPATILGLIIIGVILWGLGSCVGSAFAWVGTAIATVSQWIAALCRLIYYFVVGPGSAALTVGAAGVAAWGVYGMLAAEGKRAMVAVASARRASTGEALPARWMISLPDTWRAGGRVCLAGVVACQMRLTDASKLVGARNLLAPWAGATALMVLVLALLSGPAAALGWSGLWLAATAVFFGAVGVHGAAAWTWQRVTRQSGFCRQCRWRGRRVHYTCNHCGSTHKRLWPSQYGAFAHTCQCGSRLLCGLCVSRTAATPICPGCRTPLDAELDVASSTVVIALAGGAASGKSTWLTAAVEGFMTTYVALRGWRVTLSAEDAAAHRRAKNSLSRDGRVDKTVDEQTPGIGLHVSGHQHKLAARQLFLCDIQGDLFSDRSDRLGEQQQLREMDGVVFFIDVLSLPVVRQQFDARLTPRQRAAISSLSPLEALNRLLAALRARHRLGAAQPISKPLAVVLTKGEWIGEAGAFINAADVRRRLLTDWDARALVQTCEAGFRKVRFFLVNSQIDTGPQPQLNTADAIEPLVWLLSALNDPLGMPEYEQVEPTL